MLLERENNRHQEQQRVPQTPQSPTQSSTASSFMSNSTIPTSVASYSTTAKVLTGPGGKPRRPLSQRYPTQPPYDRWRRAVDADAHSIAATSASASAADDNEEDAFADADGDGEEVAPRATRPTPERFDSLQELLEQAGYKDTRVITPQANVLAARAARGRSATPIVPDGSHTPRHSVLLDDDTDRTPTKSNFSAVSAPVPATSREQTPTATTGGGSSSSSGWFGSLWRGLSSTSRSRSPSPAPASRTVVAPAQPSQGTPASPRTSVRSASASSPTKARKTSAPLRNARSAAHLPLWKASRSSHAAGAQKYTGTTSALAHTSTSPPVLQSKGSLGQLRNQTASIGVGISAADGGSAFGKLRQRTSKEGLTHAFFTADAGSPTAATYSASIDEWRRNLVNVKGPERPAIVLEDADADDVSSPPRFRLAGAKKAAGTEAVVTAGNADLFGSLATPIVTADPAVAPRNAECFAGPDARGLRHAKSVEALRGALKNSKKLALKERHSIIGQFARGAATTSTNEQVPPVPPLPSMPSDPSIRSMGVGKTVYQDASQMASPERPNGPPVLTLTSPSGVHSPQFIRLDSREFSLSLSPEQQRRILARCAGRASKTSHSSVDESDEMLITEESLPSQLRNIGGAEVAEGAAHPDDDADAQRRRFAMGPRRYDSQDAFSDGESSAGSSCGSDQPSQDGDGDCVPRRRKTRRGCRGGRSHNKKKTSMESLGAAAGKDAAEATVAADAAAPRQPLRRKTSARGTGRRGQNRPATADGALQHATTNTMRSFGSALQGLPRSTSPADVEEDDPFIAHVTQAEELKRHRSMSASALHDSSSRHDEKTRVHQHQQQHQHQGIASILFEEAAVGEQDKDNDENVRPKTPPKLRSRGSNSALRGRIVGRSRPMSSASSASEQEERAAVSARRAAAPVPVTMGAAVASNVGTDSPTRPVAARRLKSSRSRVAL